MRSPATGVEILNGISVPELKLIGTYCARVLMEQTDEVSGKGLMFYCPTYPTLVDAISSVGARNRDVDLQLGEEKRDMPPMFRNFFVGSQVLFSELVSNPAVPEEFKDVVFVALGGTRKTAENIAFLEAMDQRDRERRSRQEVPPELVLALSQAIDQLLSNAA